MQKWAAITTHNKAPHHGEVSEDICLIMIAINEPLLITCSCDSTRRSAFGAGSASLIANGKCSKKSPKLILKTALKYLTNIILFGSSRSGKDRSVNTDYSVGRGALLVTVLRCIALRSPWSSLSSCF